MFRGIAAAEKAGFSPIKINAVVMKGFNDDEVLDFAQLALKKPFQIRFIEIMPISEVNANQPKDFLPTNQLFDKIQQTLQA